MFLRFTKGKYDNHKERIYRKCIFLGDALVMEYGEDIIGVAKLHEESNNYLDYDVIVAKHSAISPETIARYIKDMIGKSNKFRKEPSHKRRKYYVDVVDCKVLPIKASIHFTAI